MNWLTLSARFLHLGPRLARTTGDLAGSEVIGTLQVTEALQYRQRKSDWSAAAMASGHGGDEAIGISVDPVGY
jgi:hypothetical protein